MLSRPNIVMNHGSPAAGRLFPRATKGEKRRAARSMRLRRYVFLSDSWSHSSLGASASHFSRLCSMFGRASAPLRTYLGRASRSALPSALTTSIDVVQLA